MSPWALIRRSADPGGLGLRLELIGCQINIQWMEKLKFFQTPSIQKTWHKGGVTNWHFSRSFYFYFIALTLVVIVQGFV